MKIRLSIFMIAVIVFAASACSPLIEKDSPELSMAISDIYNVDSDGHIMNYLSTVNVPYERGDNYEIFTDASENGLFASHYYVYDVNGVTIDEGFHDWRGSFGFTQKDDFLELDYGLGGLFWQRRYYDVSNGRVSRFFSKPLQTHGELVTYFTRKGEDEDLVLVVQNMFDPSKYYQEIERNFSFYVITVPSTAEFLEDGKKLRVTYWIKPDNEEVTEIIDLM